MSAIFCMVLCVSSIQLHPFSAAGILQTHASPPAFQGFIIPVNRQRTAGDCPALQAVNRKCAALRGECCRLTATLTNTAALLRLDLCKDCRDLFLYINYISFYYGANHYLTKTCAACLTCWLWEELECLLTRRALFIAGPSVHFQLSRNVARLYVFAFLLRVFNTLACFCFLPLLAVRMMDCNPYPHPDIQACLQSSSGDFPFSASSWFHFALLFPKG